MPIVLAFSVTITASKNSSIWYNSSTGVSESTVGNAGSITSPIFFANASFGEPDSDNTRKIVFSDILPTIFSLSNTGNWERFFARITERIEMSPFVCEDLSMFMLLTYLAW